MNHFSRREIDIHFEALRLEHEILTTTEMANRIDSHRFHPSHIFLNSLPEKNRNIFLLRYWYFIPLRDIARRCGMTEGAVKMILQRVRSKLKEYLEKEGVGI